MSETLKARSIMDQVIIDTAFEILEISVDEGANPDAILSDFIAGLIDTVHAINMSNLVTSLVIQGASDKDITDFINSFNIRPSAKEIAFKVADSKLKDARGYGLNSTPTVSKDEQPD